MGVIAGPFLSLRGASGAHWRVSALWLQDAADAPPVPSASAPTAVAVAPAVSLARSGGWQAWRVDFTVTRPASGRIAVTYGLPGEPPARFSVPAAGEPLRFAFASCNGFADAKYKKKLGARRNARWASLLAKHAEAPLDFVVLGGDQVYGDSIWTNDALEWLSDWLALDDAERAAFVPSAEQRVSLADFYFRLYAKRWRQESVRDALASLPSLAMWDDHDIVDGWGSQAPELQDTRVFAALFAAADRAFRVFQLQVRPDELPPGAIAGAALSWAQRIDDVAIVALDLRTQRSETQLLTPAAWQAALAAIEAAAARRPKHLFLVSGPPVAYPSTTTVQKLLELIPGEQTVEDDLRDRWGAKPHLAPRRALVRALFDAAAAHRVRVTILSGDVHHAALGTIRDKRPGAPARANTILNLVSSAIVHAPPPKIAIWALKVLDEKLEIGKQLRAEMSPLPGTKKPYIARRNYLLIAADAQHRFDASWWIERRDLPAGEERRRLTIEPA